MNGLVGGPSDYGHSASNGYGVPNFNVGVSSAFMGGGNTGLNVNAQASGYGMGGPAGGFNQGGGLMMGDGGMSGLGLGLNAGGANMNMGGFGGTGERTPKTGSPVSPPNLSSKIKQRGHVYDYKGQKLEIRDVWKDNLEDEMKVIRETIVKYPYVAMDTEFPGVVARPIGSYNSSVDFQYQTLRCNVDLLKLIQLGVALADEDGNFAPDCPCWQFHFQFSLTDDMYAQDSIDLLVRSGIDFDLHESMGIDVADFGESLVSSGLVLTNEVKWISFHGGYDFGYLLRLLTCTPLPAKEEDFFKLLHTYFCGAYDVKHIMTNLEGQTFKAGLNRLADELGADRVGPEHQAGSDSLLTASVFFALRKRYFNGNMSDEGHAGVLHGIGVGDPARMFS